MNNTNNNNTDINNRPKALDIISDIHLERFNNDSLPDLKQILSCKSQYLAVVGDICKLYQWPKVVWFFDFCSKHYKRVFYVLGNHEFYINNRYAEFNINTIEDLKYKVILITKLYPNVHILDNSAVVIDNNIFFGTTLWSKIYNQPNDKLITYKMRYTQYKCGIKVKTWNKMHYEACDALSDAIEYAKIYKLNLYVLSHYAPTYYNTIDPKYMHDSINYLYCTELSVLFSSNIKCWIFGHTGHNCDYYLYGTRVVSNQYLVESGNKYNKNLSIGINNE